MSARRIAGPFGFVTQEECNNLVAAGASYCHVAALLALRVRAGSSGWTTDGAPALARRVGMSAATMRRALTWLVANGVVVQDSPRVRPANRSWQQGGSWSSPRRALDFSSWPRHMRKVTTSTRMHGDAVSPDDTLSPVPGHLVTTAPTPSHGTRHIPENVPERSPELSRKRHDCTHPVAHHALALGRSDGPRRCTWAGCYCELSEQREEATA